MILRSTMSMPQVSSGPMSAVNPSAAMTDCALYGVTAPSLCLHVHGVQPPSSPSRASTWASVTTTVAPVVHVGDAGRVGAEVLAAVHDGDRRGRVRSSASAQSTALSPPPTMTTSCPACAASSLTT